MEGRELRERKRESESYLRAVFPYRQSEHSSTCKRKLCIGDRLHQCQELQVYGSGSGYLSQLLTLKLAAKSSQ